MNKHLNIYYNNYFQDVLEKTHRACNNIKLYLTSDDYDGAINFILTFFDSFFNNNNRTYYKLLKLKFLYYLSNNKYCLALDLYKEQIEVFSRESFTQNQFTRIEKSLALNYKLDSEANTELLRKEKEAFKQRIYKPIFLYIGNNCIENNEDCEFNYDDLCNYLEGKYVSNNETNNQEDSTYFKCNENNVHKNLNFDINDVSDIENVVEEVKNNPSESLDITKKECIISYSDLINSLKNHKNSTNEEYNSNINNSNKKERKASNADNVFNNSLINNLQFKNDSKNNSFEKKNLNYLNSNCNELHKKMSVISINDNNLDNNNNNNINTTIFNKSSSPSYYNLPNMDKYKQSYKRDYRNKNSNSNSNSKYITDKSSIYNTIDNKSLNNFLKKKDKYYNSKEKENTIGINNFKYNRTKNTHYHKTNSTCPSISCGYSYNSNTNISKNSEFTKSFKPKFEKKEAIDKKILRKFRNFLIEKFKKRKNNSEFFLKDIFESLLQDNIHGIQNKQNYNNDFSNSLNNNFNKIISNINDMYDKSFWTMFVQDNFLPPMKYNNPVTGEYVEFKSFSNNYIFWLFSRKGCFILYRKFITINLNYLFNSFLSSSKKLQNDEQDQAVLKNYLNNFHYIYTGDNNNYLYTNYYCNINDFNNKKIKDNTYVENIEGIFNSQDAVKGNNDNYNLNNNSFKIDFNYDNSNNIKTENNCNVDNLKEYDEHCIVNPKYHDACPSSIAPNYEQMKDQSNKNNNISTNNDEFKYNNFKNEELNRLGRTLSKLSRKLYKRNSNESLNTIRERSLERSRDYDLWVYPDEIYPYLQDNNNSNSNNNNNDNFLFMSSAKQNSSNNINSFDNNFYDSNYFCNEDIKINEANNNDHLNYSNSSINNLPPKENKDLNSYVNRQKEE